MGTRIDSFNEKKSQCVNHVLKENNIGLNFPKGEPQRQLTF